MFSLIVGKEGWGAEFGETNLKVATMLVKQYLKTNPVVYGTQINIC